MTRRFLAVTVFLAATVAFLIGVVVAGTLTPARAASVPSAREGVAVSAGPAASRGITASAIPAGDTSFADIAERLNPAVVNIDATSRGEDRLRRRAGILPDEPDPFEPPQPRDRKSTRLNSSHLVLSYA